MVGRAGGTASPIMKKASGEQADDIQSQNETVK